MLNMCRHMHSDVYGSNTPESASVMADLPARGTLSCMGEPEGSGDSIDAPDT